MLLRLGVAIARRPSGLKLDSWFPTSVFGAFGGTAAAARAAGLDAGRTRHAFGIALFGAAGTLEAFSPSGQKAMMRGFITGFTAQSCVQAALFAEAGLTGVPESLCGRYGFFNSFFGGEFDGDAMLHELRHRWYVAEFGLKPWPTCRYTHAYIALALRIVRGIGVSVDEIAEVRLHVAGFAETRCHPEAAQRHPTNYNHAGHALPYLIAAAFCWGRITMADLRQRHDDPRVLRLAQRVRPVHDERFGGDDRIGPARVSVTLRDGGVIEQETQIARGDWRDPLSWDDLEAKFLDCLAEAGGDASEATRRGVFARLRALEDEASIADLISVVSGTACATVK